MANVGFSDNYKCSEIAYYNVILSNIVLASYAIYKLKLRYHYNEVLVNFLIISMLVMYNSIFTCDPNKSCIYTGCPSGITHCGVT